MVRLDVGATTPLQRVRCGLLAWGDLVMMRKQLRTLKQLAELQEREGQVVGVADPTGEVAAKRGALMKRVTRDIDPGSARDLLQRVPRACMCLAGDQGPQVQPIVLRWRDGRYLAGLPADAARVPASGQEVVVLVDEGVHWFDLRAIYLRGRVRPCEAPRDALPGRRWLEVVPGKTVAWDYGMLREVADEG